MEGRAASSPSAAVIPRISWRAARVRGETGGVGAGCPARAVRDADPEHCGRAHGGGVAASRSTARWTRRRSRSATPCACSSRGGRAVCAARQGFMRRVIVVRRLQPPSTTTVRPRIISALGEQRNVTSSRRPRPRRDGRPDCAAHLGIAPVREVLERARLDHSGRDGVDADSARRELDGEVANERFERGLRRADEPVVVEDAYRAEARDPEDRRSAGIEGARPGEREQRPRVRRHVHPSACPRLERGRMTPSPPRGRGRRA